MAGNANSGKRKDKLFNTALMLELTEAKEGRDLRKIAQNVIYVACDLTHKDMLSAANAIADRLDGKPAQAIIGGDEDDNPLRMITTIELIAAAIDKAPNTDTA
jgi:hypothetical protein